MIRLTEPRLLYMTAPDEDIAQLLATKLLAENLVACVNILPPMQSYYVWEGAPMVSEEIALIAKTTNIHVDKINRLVTELHPHTCPCIVTLPINGGFQPFLHWIKEETTP